MIFDLVIHGAAVTAALARELLALAAARTMTQSSPAVFRIGDLPEAAIAPAGRAAIAAFAERTRIDHAIVPAGRHLADFGLIAMDMDSTLITIECIDELADLVGRKQEVAAVTAAAMRGEIDWPTSLRQRVSALTGIEASALATLFDERVRLSPGAEAMLAAARAAGLRTLLVSGGFTYFTDRIGKQLRLDRTRSNTLEIADGRLTGRVVGDLIDAPAKAREVHAFADELGLERDQVIVMGDGANDLAMMAEAGVSIAYRAKPAVRRQASYCFDHVGLDGLLNLFPAG